MAAMLWLVLICLSPVDYLAQARSRTATSTEQIRRPALHFILLDEAMAIHRAQTLRFGYGSVQGYRSPAWRCWWDCCSPVLRYQQMSTALDIKLYRGDFTSKDKYACHNRSLVSLSG